MSERGYLLLADITGYTRFLTGSELDHAQGVLESLFTVILEQIKSPLTLSNIQGDAFLVFADDGAIRSTGQIIDTIEALYFGFRERLVAMTNNTTCTCRACSSIGNLDLKFILHYGNYVIHNIAGRSELSGPDVILVHRLLKNDVIEKTGIRGYALITSSAVQALGLEELKSESRAYSTTLEEFGSIDGVVLDMAERWRIHHERSEITVEENDALMFEPVSRLIPFDVATVWQCLTDPALRPRWVGGVKSINRKIGDPRRLRAGAEEHCAHGKETITLRYVDVRPFKHVTCEAPLPLKGKLRYSILTIPEQKGTRVTVRFADLGTPNPVSSLLLKFLLKLGAKKERSSWVEGLKQLEGLAAENQCAKPQSEVSPSRVDIRAAARELVAGSS